MIPRLRRLRVIIIHRTSAREKDRFVEVFSREEGKCLLLAAGVRRFPSRRAGHLEPLMESRVVVSAAARGDSIRDAKVMNAFPRIREDLRRLRVAYYIVQLLHEGTADHLPDARLYDAMRALLIALDRSPELRARLCALSAEVQLLLHLGALPDTAACGRCRRPLVAAAFSFSPQSTGFLCTRCAASTPSPHLTDAVKLLRLLSAWPVPPENLQVPAEVTRELGRILRQLLRPLKQQVRMRMEPPHLTVRR